MAIRCLKSSLERDLHWELPTNLHFQWFPCARALSPSRVTIFAGFCQSKEGFCSSQTSVKSARCTGFSHSNTDRLSDYSKPSKSAKNSPGLRAPSDCRQFHWKTCCFTAGWNWLDPSTLILAHTFGGSQVLRDRQALSKTCVPATALSRMEPGLTCFVNVLV